MVSADGRYQGSLREATPFPVAFLSDAQYATVERDELGVEQVAIYDIRRN